MATSGAVRIRRFETISLCSNHSTFFYDDEINHLIQKLPNVWPNTFWKEMEHVRKIAYSYHTKFLLCFNFMDTFFVFSIFK